MKLALIYTLLAAIATICNIGAQELSTRLYFGPYAMALSIMIGTAVGLLVKYALDKRYIFRFKANNLSHDSQTFLLYALMGVFTTAIFWGFEFTFDHLFDSKEMRYLGGVIGLAVGYFAKYKLDRRFVFGMADN
ncbi:GtrA family protein [Pseudomonas paraeruginosa]|uniref:GtrA family protein n=1 Tax=Pseudomonas aeruginosa group TaxID=136841 RepID=UPI00053D8D1B|nr:MULTISPECIES: GtrA family protein [Pseudomonas aeruginosa group]KAB0751882.1 GtrA family protein [Pseudomonas aeruginosa]MBG4069096.1 GtrA family protein [Pseudomonas aeruginosa]MBG5601375.1 GtrA family protein [Pseudomonas aeruginosa]MBH3675010.1 GtrA family protein [Pseudomonas aeruginosa]MBH9431230.1 GtrA family protein [Pseudomonas aeruginosa]